jgi:cytidylate kinase
MVPLDRQVEALERAQRLLDQQRRGHATGLTVALSREAGTPGTTVARELGARLGWAVYDHELLDRISQETGLRVSLLESVDERRKSWLLESAEALSAGRAVSESGFVRHLMQTMQALGAHGRCVIVGRGSPFILPPATTLRVRLVGERADRIAMAAARFGKSREEAARWVEETERNRDNFVKDHFNKDATDPRYYDLVLNASRWSTAECVEFIVQGLRLLESRGAGGKA